MFGVYSASIRDNITNVQNKSLSSAGFGSNISQDLRIKLWGGGGIALSDREGIKTDTRNG